MLNAALPWTAMSLPDASVSMWTSFVEAGLYIVAAILMITSAHYAVVELRYQVLIMLPWG